MYKLLVSDLRFDDIQSEFLGRACLQKLEQVGQCLHMNYLSGIQKD